MTKWFSRLERRRVVVVTKNSESYRGYVTSGDRHSVLLSQVEFLPGEEAPVQVPGEIVFLRENVDYVQLPEGR